LQLFLLAVSLPLLFMAAGVAERRRAYSLLLSEMDERKRVEERFRLVVDSTPNAMLMVNREGRITQVNPQTERLFGYRGEELLGQSLERLFPERLRSSAGESLREFFASPALRGMASSTEMFGLRKDGGEFPLEVGLTPIESAGGLLALAAITDNTERKKAEEARRELVHASRLAVLSEFTTSIAHEINQPLGAILSNADAAELLLKKSPPPLEEVRQILADIRSDDLRASEVIRRLRALLRQGEVERQPIDLNAVVNDVIFILRAEAQRRRVEVLTELSSGASMVSGDKVHLQQILLNLMLNGMEAMAQTSGERRLTLKTEQANGEVVVSVSDTGAGVSRERLPKIFERFFSTKPEGMGMGLAISRSLVEEHGGRIWVESTEGRGSVFRFALPILSSRIEMKSLEPRSSAGVTG
jgi:two-component system sensor kinase FixL